MWRASCHPSDGTKFFQWGYNEFGSYNQDFLSASKTDVPGCNPDAYDPYCDKIVHEGAYTELQVGPARTQMHTFPLPPTKSASKRGVFEWTESFKAWQADPGLMQAADYRVPVAAVSHFIASESGIPPNVSEAADKLLRAISDVPPTRDQIVSKGMPWGGLQEKLLATIAARDAGRSPTTHPDLLSRLAPGCPFPAPDETDETRPWLELLATGTFSNRTLSLTPVNFEVSDGWIRLLDEGVAKGQDTWLHQLFLGTHALEVGNPVGATSHLEASMELRPNVHAARALATFADTADAAAAGYRHAWALWEALDTTMDPNAAQLGADLSGEIAGWLLFNERWSDLDAFLTALSHGGAKTVAYLHKDRTLHAQAALAVHKGDYMKAIAILRSHCFPTYGSMRSALIQLWFTAQKLKATAAKGSPLTTAEMLRLRKHFRCDGDQTNRHIDSPCVNGPPNLGYAY